MKVYRIARARFIRDLSGRGARKYGGRWNHKGIDIIYASETRALAALEYIVHVPNLSIVPNDLSIATIHIPDSINPKNISLSVLPRSWRSYPAPAKLADLGTAWAQKNASLLLRVPSAVVEQEFNFLINPAHPDIKRVKIARVEKFIIDDRLIRPGKDKKS